MNQIIPALHSRMSGEYRAVINAGMPNEIDTGWMKNLVLDAGLNRIGSGNGGMFAYCSVGTGTTAPANSQTGLVTFIASQANTGSSGSNLGASTYAAQFNAIYNFSQGAVTGNIAEFGVGWAATNGSLFSRCLVVDGTGSPTTITLTTIDQLTVYYRLTLTPALTDSTGSVTLATIAYPYTARMANASSFFSVPNAFINWIGGSIAANDAQAYPSTSTIGAITSTPSGTPAGGSGSVSTSLSTYTNGNFYRDCTITADINAFNATGGIGAILVYIRPFPYSAACFQYGFSTPIPKDNTKTFSLTFRSSWGR